MTVYRVWHLNISFYRQLNQTRCFALPIPSASWPETINLSLFFFGYMFDDISDGFVCRSNRNVRKQRVPTSELDQFLGLLPFLNISSVTYFVVGGLRNNTITCYIFGLRGCYRFGISNSNLLQNIELYMKILLAPDLVTIKSWALLSY